MEGMELVKSHQASRISTFPKMLEWPFPPAPLPLSSNRAESGQLLPWWGQRGSSEQR